MIAWGLSETGVRGLLERGAVSSRKLLGDARRGPVELDDWQFNTKEVELFLQGLHFRAQELLGAHPGVMVGEAGTQFAVWAPNADSVHVMGGFNEWDKTRHPLKNVGGRGVWAGFVPGVGPGALYKYHVIARHANYAADKADPFAFGSERPPRTASVVCDLEYDWGDGEWMEERRSRNSAEAPLAIYEVHLGSWRVPQNGRRWFTYREIAPRLAEYARDLGFTHVELMPVTEHPFYGSWGYQPTGYFSPTSRYGTPQDFMFFVDCLHRHGLGVILDWVPSHFPTDGHGLVYFDGTHLFEHADPRKGYHPDWRSAIFNYGRNEVRSFLISSALFWLEQYHLDGLRIDGVASMLYLDYSRGPGQWIPNHRGGRENLEAVDFLQRLNTEVGRRHPDVITIAEESTAWPKVSRPVGGGGLGFGAKWDMGWMHDTLRYLKRPCVHRRWHHGELPFRLVYAFSENFILPLSHDEVVHGKGSLFGMMTGDEWQKYANLRLLYGYLYAQPGKKLLFMGSELAQWPEWNHESSVEWQVQNHPHHAGVQRWVKDLNRVYRAERSLHRSDFDPGGFEWIDYQDTANTTLSFIRQHRCSGEKVLAVFNFMPVARRDYRVGVPRGGRWNEILNSDAREYGGTGLGNCGGVEADPVPWHHRPASVRLTLPPLGALLFTSRETMPGPSASAL
jgi:1,4-alpha-glucan branching enzyme